jgi:hypothetical protein
VVGARSLGAAASADAEVADMLLLGGGLELPVWSQPSSSPDEVVHARPGH